MFSQQRNCNLVLKFVSCHFAGQPKSITPTHSRDGVNYEDLEVNVKMLPSFTLVLSDINSKLINNKLIEDDNVFVRV
jgi:hypothetical protein